MNRSCVIRVALAWAVSVAFGAAPRSVADEPFFMGLGHLPGGYPSSRGQAVSADGQVVVGFGASGGWQYFEAFRWTLQDGMVGLGSLPGRASSRGHGVSAHGNLVVGSSYNGYPGTEAFRWTEQDGMVGLGDLPGGDFQSVGLDASGDGSVIVGSSISADSHPRAEAFRWTAEQGMVGLGHIPGGDFGSVASGVSADGSVIVGGSAAEAFRWTPGEGMVGLGDLPGGVFRSYGHAVSADGSVVVGRGTSDLGSEAFRWTAEEGMIGLGDIPGGFFQSIAYAVSADGSVVVGKGAAVEPEIVASIWLAADNQMYDLGHWLVDNFALDLTGWELSSAYGISADGCTIVGSGRNPLGQVEAWIAHIPEPSTLWLLALGALGVSRRKRS